ncbi:hypothetical protein C1646_766735 [Rhizophagus diaphanus]|nr:hypothetical protein C1646_766735 [Rhizophagus diaphanus] [Rhizophagus sp. MUCL 43196]
MIIFIACLTAYLSFVTNGSSDPISDPKMVDCMSDMTLPDIKYGSIQVYLGAYQPSQDIMFYNLTNDSNYTSDELFQPSFEINAFDSGLIGGAWGLATAAYALLFGADQLRP